MSNLGKVPHDKTVQLGDPKAPKTGGQPGQGLTHGYKKIVHSKPMDLTQVQQQSHLPANSNMDQTAYSAASTIKGGKIVQYPVKDMSGPLINTLDQN